MTMFFTLLYILTACLSPGVVFGPLAAYHVEIFIASIATIISIPALLESNVLRLPQTLAIAGMAFAVFASLVAGGWLGGAPGAVYDFLPNVFIYFLIVLHCKTKRHLQLIILTMLFVATFDAIHGWLALRANDATSLYVYDQGIGEGITILRIRGLSFLNDPNDFSQFVVSLLPALFFFWKKDALLRNFAFVLLPLVWLIYAMYLTHSRGAVVALLVVIVLAARRKVGTVPAVLFAGLIFIASSAAGWSGGREISVEAGSDRMDAWATGLQLIRSHPIFGVGLFRFTDYNSITAHNTIVVCAAELGFVGLFFWVLFVFSSIQHGVALGSTKKISSADPELGDETRLATVGAATLSPATALPGTLYKDSTRKSPVLTGVRTVPGVLQPYAAYSQLLPESPTLASTVLTPVSPSSYSPADDSELEDAPAQEKEIRRLAGLMVVTLCGYLAAGWFLSRAYVMTLYIYGGMIQVLFQMAINRGFAPKDIPISRLVWICGALSTGLLLLVYVILRLRSLTAS